MNCHIGNQTAIHTNADNQACAEMEVNEQAITDLFEHEQAEFSNGCIDLSDVIIQSITGDSVDVQVILSEMLIADADRLKALQSVLRNHLSGIAAEQNEAMANSH